MPKPRKKRPLWQFDPTIFQPGPKASIIERAARPFRFIARYGLYGLAFAYPLYLVTIGIALGGLAFWSAFVGSIALIGIIITKAGYARNFQNWDISFTKMGALALAFLATFGLYFGLIHLGLLVVPIFAAILVVGLAIFTIRGRL